MASHFLYPSITSLPRGYDCTVAPPVSRLAATLAEPAATVDYRFRVFVAGEVLAEHSGFVALERGEVVDGAPPYMDWRGEQARGRDEAGFLELEFWSRDQRPIFATRIPLAHYAIYKGPGRKSFFSDNAYKYGAPPVIDQVARFGQYLDAYPVIHLDRARNLGESIVLINPYKRPVLARIAGHDGRQMPRLKVAPLSARMIALAAMLQPDEDTWLGQIQLSANNRVIAFSVKHDLDDPTMITDHEHLDPFRSDPTHVPLTQAARAAVGGWLGRLLHGGARR